MTVEIKVPVLGESLSQATVARWLKKTGDFVKAGETILELETDKVTLDVSSPVQGILEYSLTEGTDVEVGQFLASVEEKEAPAPSNSSLAEDTKPAEQTENVISEVQETKVEIAPVAPAISSSEDDKPSFTSSFEAESDVAPTAQRERREPMSRLRRTIAHNLKDSQNTAVILTTFNEVDMTAVKELRAQYKELFEKKYDGTRLGFMSFFARAVVKALEDFPALNASIDGNDVIYRDFVNLGIAVGTERGLVVPVIKGAEHLGFAELENKIANYGKRARSGNLALNELEGGSFTITNGGVFGSLLSTPILNSKQSGVLGMHAIQDRPVAKNGEVVIRPMMYIALSYDHRLVDGREAVSFLVRVKELIEDPRRLLLEV